MQHNQNHNRYGTVNLEVKELLIFIHEINMSYFLDNLGFIQP